MDRLLEDRFMEGRGMGGIDSVGTERFIDVVVFVISLPLHLRRSNAILLSCETFLEREKRFERKRFKILGRSR